jgi:hypothetical protein
VVAGASSWFCNTSLYSNNASSGIPSCCSSDVIDDCVWCILDVCVTVCQLSGSGPWFPGSVTPGMRHQARHCIHIVALPEVAARLMELINVAGYPSAATMLLCPRCRCCSILAFWARDRDRKGSA